jgi:hypothetical protein
VPSALREAVARGWRGLTIVTGRRVGRSVAVGARTAAAQAGEWHTSDPGAGLASSVRWRVDADRSLPRLLPGARLGDAPVLAVPAGGPSLPTTARGLVRIVRSELPEQARHLGHARATGRLTNAEVALGAVPVDTAVRTVVVDPA